ncbi:MULTISPECIES: hypothetical protein [Paenibacillus]|uniref:hypothetical protein n=1 Tax=Paenibacillus TaxID=44249 RepID=UPI0022B864E0|nr:hypothetical protein [Paenibacillus caseinilyticus]MCZ8520433.1 hypothetical protein [Paenibacillus caseinilyticus]
MNRYMLLLAWEMDRFGRLYGALLLAVLLSQTGGVLWFAYRYMNSIREKMDRDSLTAAEYAVRAGRTSFAEYTASLWFMGPIALVAAALLLYAFLIWYREWYGKSTFVCRLLLLPASRMNIYLAKLVALSLFVLGFVAFELLLLPLLNLLFHSVIPGELIQPLTLGEIVRNHPLLPEFVPRHFIQFVFYYLTGLTGTAVLFTAILLERSFRLKGAAAGLVYALGSALLFLSPYLAALLGYMDYFYPNEILLLLMAAGLLTFSGALGLASYLLNNNVSV